MAWANFAILGIGGLLVTVPVVLHLLMQPKPKLLTFPALRFVKARHTANKSRMRLRHMLLLLLRCLLIALVALAFAGPRVASQDFGNWLTLGVIAVAAIVIAAILAASALNAAHRNWVLISILGILLLGLLGYAALSASKLMGNDSLQLIGDSNEPIAALVVIDTSPRMDYVSDNETRIEKAKSMGTWLVEQFPIDSQVCVLATDNDRPFFSVDVGAARKRIETLDLSFVSGNIPDSLEDGLQLLKKAPENRKEIYVITDMTLPSWTSQRGSSIANQLRELEGLGVYVIDVGTDSPTNFSLSPPELSKSTLPKNGGLKLNSEMVRTGPAAQRTVRLTIEKRDRLPDGKLDLSRPQIRDGKTLVPEQFWERNSVVDIREDGSALVEFQFNEPLPLGTLHGKIEIVGDDGLKVDNVRYFTIEVREPWKTLIVHPENVYPENLEFTLAPKQDVAPGDSLFATTTINQRNIDRPNFSDYQAIFLLDPTPLPNTTWGALKRYVETGGGLGIFLGPNASDDGDPEISFLGENASQLFSGKLDFQWRRPDGKLFLSPDNLSHPVFAPFRSFETGVPWSNHPIYSHWGIEPLEEPGDAPTQTILRFGNGKEAIVERQLGEGRVLTMLTPITEIANPTGRRPWNDLFLDEPPPWPMFWLLKQMCEYLVQSNADTLNVDVGQVATLRNDREKYPAEYRMFSPREPGIASLVTIPDNTFRFRFTEEPGHYRLKGLLDEPVVRGFSVNLPAEATNLSRVDTDEVDLVLGANQYQLAVKQDEIQRKQGTTRTGQEFFPLLILMMVMILGVENLVSNRFYKAS